MDYRNAFAISAVGMSVEKLRIDTVASNLANMHSTRGADGQLYQPMKVVVNGIRNGFATQLDRVGLPVGLSDVKLQPQLVPPRIVHDPGHPDADTNGNVAYPGVSHLNEIVTLSSALRAYEANVVAMNTAKMMAQRALDIGGNV